MTDYTKTTNFAAKDSLPSGNANKIVKGAEIDTEFNNIATASATKANIASPTFTGTVTIPTADINGGAVDATTIGASSASSIVGTTIVANTSINIAGDGATVTGIKDEDDMSSNSATKLATQQSIKAYVDSQVTAQDLDVTDGSASIDIDLDSESLGILGGTGLSSTASGTSVTLAIDSTVATLTGSQTLTNKTLTAPTLTGTAVVASLDISGDVDVDGTLETDALSINGTTVTSTAAELNILDGVTSTAAELNILDGVTSTTAELNILDGVTATAAELNIMDGVTATTAELNIMDGVTSTAAELNILDGKAFLDEDNMASNSATGIASQQSIKAYVDAQITAEDLDFQADSGGALSIDLDSETLTFTGGTGIDTSGSGNAVTFAIDSTVATLTGSQTLTNKTLTAPTLTGTAVVASLDISGDIDVDGTTNLDVVDIDGAVDMASTLTVADDVNVDSGTLFVDVSADSIGINTTTPSSFYSTSLVVNVPDEDGITIVSPTTGLGYLMFADGTSGNARFRGFIGYEHDGDLMQFATSGVERLRIDSSGNVGIGTSTTTGNSGHSNIFLGGTANIYADSAATADASLSISQNAFVDSDGSWEYIVTDEASNYYQNAGNHVWRVAASGTAGADISWQEAMRIDNSGNLLVGTSDAVNTASNLHDGVTIYSDGRTDISRSGGQPINLRRRGSDGTLAAFYKEASGSITNVGSIGTLDSNSIYIGNGEVNLRMIGVTNDIRPATSSGANRDAAVDLGDANARFKDLYLSGTANVGNQVKFNAHSGYDERTIGLDSTGLYVYNATDSRYDLSIDSSGNVLVGTTDTTLFNNTSGGGIGLMASNRLDVARAGDVVSTFNRMTDDGSIIQFYAQGALEGSIDVSGNTVSLVGFSGAHASSVIDRVSEEGDIIVSGVGIGEVKVTGACAGGDLLESNGDGTAKVQSDDIIRSKTIGKVTIGNGDEGVKLVSCVLYCG
jgi:hypothetical protein